MEGRLKDLVSLSLKYVSLEDPGIGLNLTDWLYSYCQLVEKTHQESMPAHV